LGLEDVLTECSQSRTGLMDRNSFRIRPQSSSEQPVSKTKVGYHAGTVGGYACVAAVAGRVN
jgi:hypothetical protein